MGKSDDAEAASAQPAAFGEVMEEFRREWKASGNPLHAWRAIKWWYVASEPNYGRTDWVSGAPPLPDWILLYLLDAASRIEAVAQGFDLRKDDGTEAGWKRMRATRIKEPKARMARIPDALGFVRPGWDAFDAQRRVRIGSYALSIYTDLRQSHGMGDGEAVAAIAEADGVEERTVRRWLASGRRGLTKPTG